ncbi:MAG: major facilitator superfamily protein [Candidatus Peregrinibacteria bacterium GW2011_GWC2_39_14]|nr:MAG: Major facilitator superfamily [Candidatus Peregrinibacteria bacterium GW2011_GWA2_38_36]KKR07125.1 MAG: major facilitator superfamily protein [Candidatus Peregrinibacteria bacterium GW2011_GWC2_39_14]
MRRNTILFGFTSFFADIAGEMLIPLLPGFLKNTLGLSTLLIGVIEGAADSISSFMKIVSGQMSDYFRRRKIFVMLGYFIAALGKPLLAVAGSFWIAIAARLLDRTGKGVREAPRDALLAGDTDKGKRGEAFGFLKSLDTLGAIVGNLLAFLLVYLAFNVRDIFWFAFIPGMLAVAVVSFVKEKDVPDHIAKVKAGDIFRYKRWKGMFKRKFWKFILVIGIFSLARVGVAFLLLRAGVIIGANNALIPILYLLYNIVFALTAWPVGRLADRFSKRKFIYSGFIIFALMCFGFIFATTVFEVGILFVLYGLFSAFTDGNSRAFVSNVTEESNRATGLGILHAVEGLLLFPGGVICGALWMIGDGIGTFVYSGILAVIAALLFFILFFNNDKNELSTETSK